MKKKKSTFAKTSFILGNIIIGVAFITLVSVISDPDMIGSWDEHQHSKDKNSPGPFSILISK